MTSKTKHVVVKPTFNEEKLLWKTGIKHIAGVDEVGRGCFAGPVVAAAVILPQGFNATDEINDSKKLTAKKREKLSKIIQKHAVSFSIAEVSVEVINAIGVGKAAQKAFVQAVQNLHISPEFILMDAFYITGITKKIQKPIIHGDGISMSIAAASIIAKVYRDNIMRNLHEKYAMYDFATNKGYGTKKHQAAMKQYGLCDLHRTSFHLTKFTLSES
jgi:ribonuclease HII